MKTPAFPEAHEAARNLTTRSLLSQLIMIEFPGTSCDDYYSSHYRDHPWGGVILFASNVDNEHQLKNLTSRLLEISKAHPPHAPLFISVDHEGGIVSRFSFDSIVPLCGNMALGASGSAEYAYESGRICALDLLSLGINLDFAPVLDVNNNPGNPIIGARSFGESPELVASLGKAAIRGLREGGIIPAAKHFPGHGDTIMDSHSSLPLVSRTKEELLNIEIPPFKAAIEDNVEMIMTAHIIFPALEPSPGVPATLSRAILTDFLRDELNFRGAVITDSMLMKAITSHFGYEEAAIRAFEAGVDMVLLCGSQEQQLSALKALEGSVDSGRLKRENLEQSFERLFSLRKAIRGPITRPEQDLQRDRDIMRKITASTITLLKNEGGLLPLRRDDRVVIIMPSLFPLSPLGEARISPTLPAYLRKYGVEPLVLGYDAKAGDFKKDEFSSLVKPDDRVLFVAFCNGRLPEVQKRILDEVRQVNRNSIVLSLNSPYVLMDIPYVPAYINCYNYGNITMEALAAVLFGESKPAGKLPVTLPGLFPRGSSLSY